MQDRQASVNRCRSGDRLAHGARGRDVGGKDGGMNNARQRDTLRPEIRTLIEMIASAALDDVEAEIAAGRAASDGLSDSTSLQEANHGSTS
jgi:hypothetical protein